MYHPPDWPSTRTCPLSGGGRGRFNGRNDLRREGPMILWRWRLAAAALGLALAGRAAPAFEGFDAENWKPALDPYGYVTVDGARSLGALAPHAALYFSWAHDPLRLE